MTRTQMTRSQVTAFIRAKLKERSGKAWACKGSTGTAWGWLDISAPPARMTWGSRLKPGANGAKPEDFERYDTGKPGGYMSPDEMAELNALLGMEGRCTKQGVSVMPNAWDEFMQRAEGKVPDKIAEPYWD